MVVASHPSIKTMSDLPQPNLAPPPSSNLILSSNLDTTTRKKMKIQATKKKSEFKAWIDKKLIYKPLDTSIATILASITTKKKMTAERMEALVACLVKAKVRQVKVLVGGTLKRYNFWDSIEYQKSLSEYKKKNKDTITAETSLKLPPTPSELEKEALEWENAWCAENQVALKYLEAKLVGKTIEGQNRYELIRWKPFLESDGYKTAKEDLAKHYKCDKEFKENIDITVNDYLKRLLKDGKIHKSHEAIAQDHILHYLLEEGAMLSRKVLDSDYLLYPEEMNDALKAFNRFFNGNIDNRWIVPEIRPAKGEPETVGYSSSVEKFVASASSAALQINSEAATAAVRAMANLSSPILPQFTKPFLSDSDEDVSAATVKLVEVPGNYQRVDKPTVKLAAEQTASATASATAAGPGSDTAITAAVTTHHTAPKSTRFSVPSIIIPPTVVPTGSPPQLAVSYFHGKKLSNIPSSHKLPPRAPDPLHPLHPLHPLLSGKRSPTAPSTKETTPVLESGKPSPKLYFLKRNHFTSDSEPTSHSSSPGGFAVPSRKSTPVPILFSGSSSSSSGSTPPLSVKKLQLHQRLSRSAGNSPSSVNSASASHNYPT